MFLKRKIKFTAFFTAALLPAFLLSMAKEPKKDSKIAYRYLPHSHTESDEIKKIRRTQLNKNIRLVNINELESSAGSLDQYSIDSYLNSNQLNRPRNTLVEICTKRLLKIAQEKGERECQELGSYSLYEVFQPLPLGLFLNHPKESSYQSILYCKNSFVVACRQ